MYVLRNRAHVLASHLGIKLGNEDLEVEDILKLITAQLKTDLRMEAETYLSLKKRINMASS